VSNSLWKAIGRRNQIVVLVFVMCLVIVAASGGCYAHRLPAASRTAAEALGGGALPYTVSVIAWNVEPGDKSGRDPKAYARELADLMNDSHAFKASRFETEPAATADLVAISTGLKCESSVVPIFTILTLGIVPTVFDGERCDGLILRSSKPGSPPPIEIRIRTKDQVIVGWAALGFGALRNWSYGVVGEDHQYGNLLRLEVARLKADIDTLATAVPPEPPVLAPGIPPPPTDQPQGKQRQQ
jgi:hypothetical protein